MPDIPAKAVNKPIKLDLLMLDFHNPRLAELGVPGTASHSTC